MMGSREGKYMEQIITISIGFRFWITWELEFGSAGCSRELYRQKRNDHRMSQALAPRARESRRLASGSVGLRKCYSGSHANPLLTSSWRPAHHRGPGGRSTHDHTA